VQDAFAIYSGDERGRFVRKAFDGAARKIADLDGMLLTTPGYVVASAVLQPVAGGDQTLDAGARVSQITGTGLAVVRLA
jgi:hypothetical protein